MQLFNHKKQDIKNRLATQLIKDISVLAADEFDRNFERQSFFGDAWKPSAYVVQENNRRGSNRNLLIKSGALRKSILSEISGQTISYYSAVPYAEIHNQGGNIQHPGGTAYYPNKKGKAVWISNQSAYGKKYPRTKHHNINIPKRQFVGEHNKLNDMLSNYITDFVSKLLQ